MTIRAAALAVACLFALSHALAAPPAEVEDLIKRGNDLRRQGKAHEALSLLQRAYELADTPRTSVQLGLVESSLGYDLEAEGHLAAGLEEEGDYWIKGHRAALQDELRKVRARLGEISVVGSPTEAEVFINGRPSGQVPTAPIRVRAGTVKVELRAPGHTDASATVVVRGGGRERVVLNLSLAPSVSPARQVLEPRSEPQPPAATLLTPFAPVELRAVQPTSSWGPGKIAGVTLLGAGILAVAGGSVLLLLDKRQDCEVAGMPDAQCDSRRQTRVPGWALMGGGVAAGALGAILLYNSRSTTVAVSATSLHVAGRF